MFAILRRNEPKKKYNKRFDIYIYIYNSRNNKYDSYTPCISSIVSETLDP